MILTKHSQHYFCLEYYLSKSWFIHIQGLCAGCLYDKGTGYNFFPGDCSKYVQCWEQNGYVHGVVKNCSFGEFWKQDELSCRPSIHVHCPMGMYNACFFTV